MGVALGKKSKKDLGAVERRKGHEIEEREKNIEKNDKPRDGIKLRGTEAEMTRGPDDESEDRGDEEVRENPGHSHRDGADSPVREILRIVRHRLGPTDNETGFGKNKKRGQNDRAEEVEVADGVQGEPSGEAGSLVAEVLRDIAVGDLVNHDRHDEYRNVKNYVYCLHNLTMIAWRALWRKLIRF